MNYKKILYVSPFYKRKGGIASVVNQYKEYLGCDFRHFSTMDFANNFVNILLFPFKICHFVYYLLLNREIQIVHIHGSSSGSFLRKFIIFFISKNIFNKKVVYHIHASSFHVFLDRSSTITLRFVIYMLNSIDSLIVLSEWWRNYFLKRFNLKNISIVNNIVPKVFSKEKNINKKIRFLFLGRIGDRKGIFNVINAVISNKEYFNDKIEIIVGGDGDVDKLKRMIKANDLSRIFKYVGWVSGAQKIELLKECDIMILPSYNEGLPISLLEALSYRMPLISTHVGGISEILEHKINGFVVEPGNESEIMNALQFYIENNDLIKQHGTSSFKIANKYFPKQVFAQLNRIYSTING